MGTVAKVPKTKGGAWDSLAESGSTLGHGSLSPTSNPGSKHVFASFKWDVKPRDVSRGPRGAFQTLIHQVKETAPVRLYDAVEQGVPTSVVLLIAGALGGSRESVMDLLGVSETTFRRREEAKEPLPEIAGHRVMAFLRIVARLQRLLEESGDSEQMASFDLEAWVKSWIGEPLPEFGNKTPADMLRNPEGQRAVEELLERMRGGLPA